MPRRPHAKREQAAVFHLDVELLAGEGNCAVVANPPAFSKLLARR